MLGLFLLLLAVQLIGAYRLHFVPTTTGGVSSVATNGQIFPRIVSKLFTLAAVQKTKLQRDDVESDIVDSEMTALSVTSSTATAIEKRNNIFLLTEPTSSQHCTKMEVGDFKSKWIDFCIDQNRPDDLNRFALRELVGIIEKEFYDQTSSSSSSISSSSSSSKNLKEERKEAFYFYDVQNRSLELQDQNDAQTIFITAQELEKLWNDNASQQFRNSSAVFNIQDALLLIDDEDVEQIISSTSELLDAAAVADRANRELAMEHVSLKDLLLSPVAATAATTASKATVSLEELQLEVPIFDESEKEYTISVQELRRLWEVRSQIEWGCPSKEFDARSALLLLEADDTEEEEYYKAMTNSKFGAAATTAAANATAVVVDDEDDEVSDSSEDVDSSSGSSDSTLMRTASFQLQQSVVPADSGINRYVPTNKIVLDDPKQGFWRQFRGRSYQNLRDTLRRIFDGLEDHSIHRPPWKKNRRFLTPDIDTQDFMGDMMFSNTFMTKRIPANWDDPDDGGQRNRMRSTETYIASGKMLLPGEEEVDFTVDEPVWEMLQLPIGPRFDYQRGLDAKLIKEFAEERGIPITEFSNDQQQQQQRQQQRENAAATGEGHVDWGDFDFSSAEEELDATSDSLFIDALSDDDDDDSSHLAAKDQPAIPIRKSDRSKEVDNVDLVGFEVWSKYDSKYFEDAQNCWWDEEVYLAESASFLNKLWPIFLEDHAQARQYYDQRRAWQRTIDDKFGVLQSYASTVGKNSGDRLTRERNNAAAAGTVGARGEGAQGSIVWEKNDDSKELLDESHCSEFTFEEVPFVWVPDLNRGVDYTNEVFELKGKKSLKPYRLPPEVEFANDTFHLNEEAIAINRIGTIREQYEWEPRADLEHKIESSKLAKIQPVLRYLNHIATLVSTKDDILIFEYHGRLSDIIGIRASAMQIGLDCFPKLKDLRLETERTVDRKALK